MVSATVSSIVGVRGWPGRSAALPTPAAKGDTADIPADIPVVWSSDFFLEGGAILVVKR